MNSRGETNKARRLSEQPKSVRVFRHMFHADPDIVAGEVDMFPAKTETDGPADDRETSSVWRKDGGNFAFQISCVPQDNRGDEEIQTGGAVLLILVGAIADFAEPVNEDRPGQAVAGLSFVKFLPVRRRSSGYN